MNPYETRSLIATGNVLQIDQSAMQYIQADASNIGFDLVADTWGFSVCILFKSINPVASVILSRRSLGAPTGAGYYLVAEPINASQAHLYFATNSDGQCQSKAYLVDINRWYRISVFVECTGTQTNIYSKLNDQATHHNQYGVKASFGVLTDSLYIGRNAPYVGGNTNFDGLISNLIFFKGLLADTELSLLNDSNMLPESTHDKIIAHYPFNQNSGNKVFDVVAQYNYAKAVPLTAKHGDLINYSSDESGVTNPLLQNVWRNFYDKKRRGKSFLRFNQVSGYGEIESLAGYTPGMNYIFKMTVVPGNDFSDSFTFFSNKSNNNDFKNLVIMSPYNAVNGFIFEQYESSGTYHIGCNTAGFPAVDLTRDAITLIYCGQFINGSFYVRLYLKRLTGDNTKLFIGQNSATPNLNTFDYPWERFLFANDRFYPGRFGKNNFGKASFIVNPYQKYPLDFEVSDSNNVLIDRLLADNPATDFKSLLPPANILFDVDFGDVFVSAGNYYCRDNSGNSRHMKLFNYNPVTDQPLRRELTTNLPERTKALRLTSAAQHHLSIANFNPTKENGYTQIIGYKKESNVPYAYDALIAKRGAEFKGIIFNPSTTQIKAWQSYNGGPFTDAQTNDRVNYVHTRESSAVAEIGINGFVTSKSFQNGMVGYDFDNTDFCVGYDNGNCFDGYIFFVGIWKGILSDVQILNIVNNTLGGNLQTSLTDCELYLNFEEILVSGSNYTIKDWSPQNRIVTLNNYTAAEVTPGDPSYKLIDLDTLR